MSTISLAVFCSSYLYVFTLCTCGFLGGAIFSHMIFSSITSTSGLFFLTIFPPSMFVFFTYFICRFWTFWSWWSFTIKTHYEHRPHFLLRVYTVHQSPSLHPLHLQPQATHELPLYLLPVHLHLSNSLICKPYIGRHS